MEIEKFKNKYRIKSARKQGYDYTKAGFYFVTMCTKDKELYFGDIKNKKNILSPIGKIANKCYLEIPKRFSDVKLDCWIIMPNHVHGILRIDDNSSPREQNNNIKRKFGPLQKNSLSSIVNHYKGSVTKLCRKLDFDFIWQPLFYDRIIRGGDELGRIRQYILDNPIKWELDRNNFNNL